MTFLAQWYWCCVYELSSLKPGQDVIVSEILWLFGEIAC